MAIEINWCVTLAVGLGVVGVLSARPASAVLKRAHASSCHIIQGSQSGLYGGTLGIVAVDASLQLACPIPESPDLARTSITAIEIYAHDDDVNYMGEWVQAKACRSYSSSNGGTCGAVSQTGSNSAVLMPSLTAWSTNTGFAYVWIGNMWPDDNVRGYAWSD